MHKNIKFKIILPLALLIVIIIIVIFLLIQKPKMIEVTTVKTPYSTLSDINETDSLVISLYVNQTNSYITDKDKITSCTITSNDNLYKLKLINIEYGDLETTLHNQKYYLYYYVFNYDFKFLSAYNDYLSKAYLNMEFSNGIKANIEIGSLSIVKYVNEETNLISDIAITQTRTITTLQNKENDFYGITLGIRNLNTEKEVKIKQIIVIDESIKQIDNFKEVDNMDINFYDYYPNYPSINDYPSSITIDKKQLKMVTLPIIQNNDNDIKTGSFGLKVIYEINNNGVIETKEYYFKKFSFYNYYYSVSEDNLSYYEYEFK